MRPLYILCIPTISQLFMTILRPSILNLINYADIQRSYHLACRSTEDFLWTVEIIENTMGVLTSNSRIQMPMTLIVDVGNGENFLIRGLTLFFEYLLEKRIKKLSITTQLFYRIELYLNYSLLSRYLVWEANKSIKSLRSFGFRDFLQKFRDCKFWELKIQNIENELDLNL